MQSTYDDMDLKIDTLTTRNDELESQNNHIYSEKTKLVMERFPIYDVIHKLTDGKYYAFGGEIWKCVLSKEGYAEIGHVISIAGGTWNMFENAYDAPDEVLAYFELTIIEME